jgi:hypothetical protein
LAERFVEERLDDLVFGHGLHDAAANEDFTLAVAGRNTEIGFAGFARAVDDTTHDGDAQRDGKALEERGDLFGEGVEV